MIRGSRLRPYEDDTTLESTTWIFKEKKKISTTVNQKIKTINVKNTLILSLNDVSRQTTLMNYRRKILRPKKAKKNKYLKTSILLERL